MHRTTRTDRATTLALLALAVFASVAGAVNLEYVDSDLWTRARDCDLTGDTLAVVLEYGVQLWDIGDEANSMLLGDFYLEAHRGYALDRHGDILAVTTLQKDLVILDVSDPANPTQLARVAGIIGTSPDVALREDAGILHAYVGGNTDLDGLKIFDLSDPANPTVVGAADISGLESVALSGDTMFALAAGAGLYSLDISDLSSPAPLDTILPIASYFNVSANGGLAAVAANNDGCYVIDVSDPSNMNVLAQIAPYVNELHPPLRAKEAILAGTILYVITDWAGPLVYDLADPANPLLIGYDPILDQEGAPYTTFTDGDLVGDRLVLSHWASRNAGVLIFDVSSDDPLPLGRAATPDYNRFAGIGDGLLFSCNGESGITCLTYDAQAGELVLRGNLMLTQAYGVSVDVQDSLAYVASTSDGLVITDWTDPSNPVELGNLDVGQARDVKVVDDRAYVAAFTQGVWIVDVSDSLNPIPIDHAVGGASVRLDVSADEMLLASAAQNTGLNLWDISDPANIVLAGNYPVDNRAADVLLHGDYAFVVDEGQRVHVVDISDPANPFQAHVFHDVDSDPQGLAIVNSELMIASGIMGVASYDISDPLAPVFNDLLDTPGTALAIRAQDGQLLVADDSGLTLMNYTVTGTPLAPVATVALTAFPNPFNPQTTLRFEIERAARVDLSIYDASGRHLRRLAAGQQPAGTVQLRWDGRDDRGQALASGVYLVRLRLEDGSQRSTGGEKLVLIR